MRNEEAVADQTLEASKRAAKAYALMNRVTGTSASDCQITMELQAESRPAATLSDVSQVLLMMNHHAIEKKAHRQALAKAGRKALAKLCEASG